MTGGGSGNQTTVSVEKPWEPAGKYLKDVYSGVWGNYVPSIEGKINQAGIDYGDPMAAFYYQGDRVAPMNQDQYDAMQMTRSTANNVAGTINPVYDPMTQILGNQNLGEITDAYNNVIAPTVAGQYLDPNSNIALQRYVQSAIDPIVSNTMENLLPTWDNQAVASGRYGGSSWQQGKSDLESNMMQQIGNTAAGIYAPAYENERARQMQAANYAPSLYQMLTGQQIAAADPFQDIVNQYFKQAGYLSAAGESEQAQQQALIDAEMQKFQEGIYSPLDFYNSLANLFMSGGAQGRTTQTTSPYSGPGLSQSLLGGGSSIAGILKSLGIV